MSQNEIWEEEDWFPEETKNPGKQIPSNLEEKYSVALASNRTGLMAENETKDRGTSNLKAEEAIIMKKQIPAILDPRNGSALVKIVNQLDPSSFVKLAKTCRAIHDFCFNSKDIKITYNVNNVFCKHLYYDDYYYEYISIGYTLKFECYPLRGSNLLESVKARRQIQDLYPFVFSIGTLRDGWNMFTERGMAILRWLLDDLPIQKISELSVTSFPDIVSCDSFFRFLQDFHVDSVLFFCGFVEYVPEEITKRLVTSGLKKLSCGPSLYMIDQTAILDATVPFLELWGMELSSETFDALVLKCIDSAFNIDWSLWFYNRDSPFELHDRGLYKTLPFNYDGPIPEERPIVFVMEDDPLHFCMLRKDNTVFRFVPHYGSHYTFSVSNNPTNWPPCIRSIGIPTDLRKTLSITY